MYYTVDYKSHNLKYSLKKYYTSLDLLPAALMRDSQFTVGKRKERVVQEIRSTPTGSFCIMRHRGHVPSERLPKVKKTFMESVSSILTTHLGVGKTLGVDKTPIS